jgi:branched-chain amino acid transport system ATP-binding protein
MALAVADSAFVLDIGRVSLSGSATELAATDAVQRLYLGHGSDEDGDGHGAAPVRPTARARTLSRWTA